MRKAILIFIPPDCTHHSFKNSRAMATGMDSTAKCPCNAAFWLPEGRNCVIISKKEECKHES